MSNLSKTFRYVNANGEEIIFDVNHGYLIDKPKGIDRVSVNFEESVGWNRIGTVVTSQSVASRPVTINGIVFGADQEALKAQLLRVMRPGLAGKLYAGDYFLDVFSADTPEVSFERRLASFSAQLIAAYPYWQRESSETVYFGGSLGDTILCKIDSDCEVPFVLHFNVGVSGVKTIALRDATRNKWLTVKAPDTSGFQSGDTVTVTIRHDGLEVYCSSVGDAEGLIQVNSKLFRLQPGSAYYSVYADGVKNSQIGGYFEYRPERIGVVL